MNSENRNFLLEKLFIETDKFKLRHPYKRILQNNHYYLYMIWCLTSFLPAEIDVRERLFYIEKNINVVRKCEICNKRKVVFDFYNLSFKKTCNNKKCLSELKSLLTKEQHKNMSEIVKKERSRKISEKNRGTLEERFGIEKADMIKKNLSENSWNKGLTKDDDERLLTHAKRMSGEKNHNFGKRGWSAGLTKENNESIRQMSQSMKRRYEENPEILINIGKKVSKRLKAKIENGTFTPCITNSWTHWQNSIEINGKTKKFRSSWEAIFWCVNQHLEYEKTRIRYNDSKNNSRVYIVDFTDTTKKILYEIKPSSLINDENNVLKLKSAKNWCDENDFEFKIIDERWFCDHIEKIESVVNLKINKNLVKIVEGFKCMK